MIVCANFAKKVPLEGLLPLVKALGFRHIQFSFVHYGINDDNPLIDDSFLDKAKQIKNTAENYGLTFPVIHGWLPSTGEAIKILGIYLKVRELLNSQYMVIHPKDKTNLNFIIKLIEGHQSKQFLLIENVAEPAFKMGLMNVKQIIKAKINLCFDTCHALEKNLDIANFLTEFKRYIKVVHLSDFDGEKRHLSIGTSKITADFVDKLPDEVIVVFEHKAKFADEYSESYGTSLERFVDYQKG